jgi:uncharacterized membrane protein SpoIIM required for sporulation
MTRKIDFSRVHKVVRFLIIIISVLTLLIGIYSTIKIPELLKLQEESYITCLAKFEHSPDQHYYCSVFLEMNNDVFKIMTYSLFIGIGLPIVFFGGGKLINYFAPVAKSKKDKS